MSLRPAPCPGRPGGAARWWLHHALAALDAALAARGQRLVLRRGPAPRGRARPCPGGRRGARALQSPLRPGRRCRCGGRNRRSQRDGIAVETFKANLLHEPDEIRGPGGAMKVFSAFWRKAAGGPPPPSAPARTGAPAAAGRRRCGRLAQVPRPPPHRAGLGGRPSRDLDARRGRRPRAPRGLRRGWPRRLRQRRDYPAEPATSRLSPAPPLRRDQPVPHPRFPRRDGRTRCCEVRERTRLA